MNNFVSYSQVGQDAFAYEQIGAIGTFLDIGSNDPVHINNSFALEQKGWRGLAIDINPRMVEMFKDRRKTPVLLGDAEQVNWKDICAKHQIGPVIDYLSLDVDGGELLVLHNLIKSGLSFRVITCEHNRYHRGDVTRNPIRELLSNEGYELVRPDVKDGNFEFEDWWIKR